MRYIEYTYLQDERFNLLGNQRINHSNDTIEEYKGGGKWVRVSRYINPNALRPAVKPKK